MATDTSKFPNPDPHLLISTQGPPQPSANPKSVKRKVPSGTTRQSNITPVQAGAKSTAAKKAPQLSQSQVPKKESTPPPDVALARAQQTNVLLERQRRETRGYNRGAPRDVDAGSGYWPPLSPLN